jgi:RNA polymerase sigma-70 factor (ECF subfamily)
MRRPAPGGGDGRAEFERTALPHVDALHGVAARLCRASEDAEDLVQETLLRAYRFRDTYEPGTNVRAWLLRILRNLFISRYRSGKREPEPAAFDGLEESLERLILGAEGGGRSPTPEQLLLDGSLDEEVEEALRSLPEEYRLVLLLASVEGLAYKEIAEVVGCPIGTVMSRLHRARRLMQSRLAEYAAARGLLPGGRAERSRMGA